MTNQPFTILAVCTGNLCRSPLAAALLRGWAASSLPASVRDSLRVVSAGTRAPVGTPMSEHAVSLARELGVEPGAHEAQQLTEQMLREADLVLVATRAHRHEVARMLPRAARVLYTFRELGALAADVHAGAPPAARDRVEDLQAALRAIAARRGLAPRRAPDDDDVIDPIGQPLAVYRTMASQLVPALAASASVLYGAEPAVLPLPRR